MRTTFSLSVIMALICTTVQIPYPGPSRTQGKGSLLVARSSSDEIPEDPSLDGNNPSKRTRPIPDSYYYSSVPDPNVPRYLHPIPPMNMDREIWFFSYLLKMACRDCLLDCVAKKVG